MGCPVLDSELQFTPILQDIGASIARENFCFIHPENSCAFGRLIKKENFKPDGTLVSSFEYTLNASDERIDVKTSRAAPRGQTARYLRLCVRNLTMPHMEKDS
jgi:hypothetical protein